MNEETRPCLLCGEETTGSVGAAGIKWLSICQPCKDKEDEALAERVKASKVLIDAVFSPRENVQ